MNALTVFNNDVIPVYVDETGFKFVLGRELHEGLKIKTAYKDWFPRMCEYGFEEGTDFSSFLSESTGGRPAMDHNLTLNMAKEIAMIQRTPEGHAIRKQLISLDTDISSLSPELRFLIKLEIQQKEQQKQIQSVKQSVEDIRQVVTYNPDTWRRDCVALVRKIAVTRGGMQHISDVWDELYSAVSIRAHVNLNSRLAHRRQNLLESGKPKVLLDKLNKLDVVAEDPKLIEIFVAVVKEMCIQSGIAA